MRRSTKSLIFNIIGYVLCIVPAGVCTLGYFPLWLGDKNSCLSLVSIFVLSLCIIPLWRMIRESLKSPSAWKLWLVMLLIFTAVEHIIVGLRAIACVACPTSALGALFFWLAKRENKQVEEDT